MAKSLDVKLILKTGSTLDSLEVLIFIMGKKAAKNESEYEEKYPVCQAWNLLHW